MKIYHQTFNYNPTILYLYIYGITLNLPRHFQCIFKHYKFAVFHNFRHTTVNSISRPGYPVLSEPKGNDPFASCHVILWIGRKLLSQESLLNILANVSLAFNDIVHINK